MGQTALTRLGDLDTQVQTSAGTARSFYIVSTNYIMYEPGTGTEGDTLVTEYGALKLHEGETAAAICARKFPFNLIIILA